MPAISLDRVSKTFGPKLAVDELSLEVGEGSVAVLLGPNGAGKTTTVRLITGALRPDTGTIRVAGFDASAEGGEVRKRCGVVPPKPAMYDRLTGRENLRFAADVFRTGRTRIEATAEKFGIAHALDDKVGGYSTGMRTRLALTRAFLHDPEILLLDEPTAGLDPESARTVLSLIMRLATEGRTVVLCTHLLHEAEGVADLVAMMAAGQVRIMGSPDELAARFIGTPRVVIDVAEPHNLNGFTKMNGFEVEADNGRGRMTLRLESLELIPDIVDRLVASGARVRRVEPLGATLEDVYFEAQRQTRAWTGE